MINCNEQHVLFCTSSADFSNLVCTGFIFITCTAANLFAIACRKSMSCGSHRVDNSTSTTIEDIEVVSSKSIENVEQGTVKENETKSSNDIIAKKCANAMPDDRNQKTVDAIWKLNLLNVMLFSIAALAYAFFAVIFLFFVHRYATGAHQDEEANWKTFWLQYLTLTFPAFYGSTLFLMRNKKLWYVYHKKI